MSDIEIAALSASQTMLAMLSEIVIDVGAHGGSVGFMHPLAPDVAEAYWGHALASAARGERIVLGAWDGDVLAGAIPDYALKPHGGLTRTLVYWKRIGHEVP